MGLFLCYQFVRLERIELSIHRWQRCVIPLNYSRSRLFHKVFLHQIDPCDDLPLQTSAADYSISNAEVQWFLLSTLDYLSTMELLVGKGQSL